MPVLNSLISQCFIQSLLRERGFLASDPLYMSFPGGSAGKNPPAMQKMYIQSLGQEDPLEKETAIHSRILAWEIHGQRSLAGYNPWGRKRVKHNLATKQ